jgi:catechol 2,3-dioxygenase-like lactoylglutathione lyase family enzyme
MTHPTFIGRTFDQLCFVVDDLDEAVDYWRRVNGVETWDVVHGLSNGQLEKTYWGEPGNFEYSCAYGVAGGIIIELARHEAGRSVYQDWLKEHGNAPHHIGFRLEDESEYRTAERHFLDQGIEPAMSGLAVDACRWGYFDTRAQLGCFTELYWLSPAVRDQQIKFQRGESDHMIPRAQP